MQNENNLPAYNMVGEALQKTHAGAEAAEVHGMICGYLCAASRSDDVEEITRFLGLEKTNGIIKKLVKITGEQLHDSQFIFHLLLPDDEQDLNWRVEALSLWCEGFLTGLNLSGVAVGDYPSTQLNEALKDIAEITKANYSGKATEGDESAYTELVEYLRMAVLLIHTELTVKRAQQSH